MPKRGAKKELKLFFTRRERGRVVQNLRTVVDYRVAPGQVEVFRLEQSGATTFRWNDLSSSDGETPYVDSELLREAFFSVDTPEAAESFLRASGPFRSEAYSVSWAKFQEWQAYFKLQRSLGAAGKGWGPPPEYVEPSGDGFEASVLDRITRVPMLEPINAAGGQLILAARAFSAVECLAAANFLERLSHVAILTCGWCNDPFAPQTKASLFCKHACAQKYWRANGPTGRRKGDMNAKAAK